MIFIHKSAEVDEDAILGREVKVWNWAQIREGAVIGDNTIISKGVYIDRNVQIGRNCKIQNNSSIYFGVTLEDGVFIGPHVCFTNDKVPRAITSEGELKGQSDWAVSDILVRKGASLGARTVILPGLCIGEYALIGAGSVITSDIPAYSLVCGNPAVRIGWVCRCGEKVLNQYDICRQCMKKEVL